MRTSRIPLLLLFALALPMSTATAKERDRVADDFERADTDGDDRLDRGEWNRRGNFDRFDRNGDGHLSLDEVRALYDGHSERDYDWPPSGFERSRGERDETAESDRVEARDFKREARCAIARGKKCDPQIPIGYGLLATGLGPEFPAGAVCHGIDDTYALDYTFKRRRLAFHGGIDLPARWGTPMIAAAAGTVVGVFEGEASARGKEIILRHAPEDTGLDVWTYTGYGHLDRLPDLEVGDRVRLGEIIGPTGNSGVSGRGRKKKTRRRPAIHFSAFFSGSRRYAVHRDVVVPENGRWLDPIALYRGRSPLDSRNIRDLPDAEKGIPVAVMFEDGEVHPAGARIVWPYRCRRE